MTGKNKYKVRNKLTRDQIFTIPNLLSFFRILLIPVIIRLYVYHGALELTAAVIILSGLTDILDGFIARKFGMVSDFGKALDPLADKLTQIAVLFCLLTRFPLIILPLAVMSAKELFAFVLRLLVFTRTEIVESARWHGKLNTVILYAVILLHILWINIPREISDISILTATAMMALSSALYTVSGFKLLLKHGYKR
jgi:cardiolipin synthase